ncbi:sugar kinase [Cellulomonas xiejunii]|uniref:Sugar kinase n=1 Tax=Cellulomonas xiejunii TaxID=2968083 RepID=A0ABY5KQK4_9CELL|nr:sugar kinase [Cellulomonas xiejunii]MCC2321449.1 sugar kinase [Cellulomonas xiejunii]MCC2323399.1 sugar kinase [Cellulomonas xiejunii]UUI72024.1 sugar kinase [Cellulomonas xiejunii]
MSAVEAVTFGEVMGMLVADEPGDLADVTVFRRALAGAEYNVAVGLARLGHRVAWLGRVGDDPVGRHALTQMAAHGVVTDGVQTDPLERTGLQLKSRADGGDPQVEYFRRHSAGTRLTATPATDALLSGARHLHATGIPLALGGSIGDFAHHAIDVARSAGARISVDPNLRPALWPSTEVMMREVNRLVERADWVLPGLSEGRLLTGADDPAGIARYYLVRGARLVVVKDGARGAHLFAADGRTTRVRPLPVHCLDTVGAGDGFAAGLVSAALDAWTGDAADVPDLDALGLRAAATGALATTVRGDQEGLPTRAALDTFLTAAAAAVPAPDGRTT